MPAPRAVLALSTVLVAAVAATPASAATGRSAARYGHTSTGIACRATNLGLTLWQLDCSSTYGHYTVRTQNGLDAPERIGYRRIPKRGAALDDGRTHHLGPFRCRTAKRTLTCLHNDASSGRSLGFSLTRTGRLISIGGR